MSVETLVKKLGVLCDRNKACADGRNLTACQWVGSPEMVTMLKECRRWREGTVRVDVVKKPRADGLMDGRITIVLQVGYKMSTIVIHGACRA